VPGGPGSETDLLQFDQPRLYMVFLGSGEGSYANWFSADCEIVGIPTTTALNDSIKAGEPELLDLSALRLKGVTFCPKSQFLCRQFFCVAANPGLDECTGKPERGSAVVNAAKHNVHVRVLGIVMNDGDPLQFCEEALLDPFHQTASVPFKIHPLAEFWRDDDLEHPFVPSGLP
jgi:hypothetical protein